MSITRTYIHQFMQKNTILALVSKKIGKIFDEKSEKITRLC
jgi:hypothetical protein